MAKDRRGEDSQNPSPLFPVTRESIYHPNNLPVHKSSHFSVCKGDRAHPWCAAARMQLFSPSSSSSFLQGTSRATRSGGRRW